MVALKRLVALLLFNGVVLHTVSASENPTPTLSFGAAVYKSRCVLCHGKNGMGGGILASAIKGYPSTNLFEKRFGGDTNKVRQAIIYGGSKGKMHQYSPPWGNELTFQELESVVMFNVYLLQHPQEAIALFDAARPAKVRNASWNAGRIIFQSRCALCHGPGGEGDGKLSRVINSPLPFNLTQSRLPDAHLKAIITKGGGAVGRSPKMPPWEGELSTIEVDSVILYIKTLRAGAACECLVEPSNKLKQ